MLTAIRRDSQGNGVVSDGLHRVILPRVVIDALLAVTADGVVCLEVDAHPLVVIPLAPEATALEGVQPHAGEVVDG